MNLPMLGVHVSTNTSEADLWTGMLAHLLGCWRELS